MSWKTLIHEALLMRQFVCNPIHCSNYCICYFIYYVLHYTVQCIVSFCNILLIHIKYFVAFIPQATQAGSGSVHITICTLLNDQKKKEKASFKKLHYLYYRWSQLQTDWWTDLCVCFLSATWTDCQLLPELSVQLPKLWRKLEHPRACTYTAQALLCHC